MSDTDPATARRRARWAAGVAVAMLLGCAPPERPPVAGPNATASPSPSDIANAAIASAGEPDRRRLPPTEWVAGPPERSVFLALTGPARPSVVRTTLDALRRDAAVAAFFLPGRWIRAHADVARAVVAAGHVLGNAGFAPGPLTSAPRRAARTSVLAAERAIASAGGRPRPFFAAPGGRRDRRLLAVAGRLGYRSVGGTRVPTARAVAGAARPGAILRMPVRRMGRAAKRVIALLERRGLATASLRALHGVRPVRFDVTLGPGSTGPAVAYLQERLARISYVPGPADGTFGEMTTHAVVAFEKVHGLESDGLVAPEEMAQIAVSGPPEAPRREPHAYVDVDLTRQVLFEVVDGRVRHTLPVSTANGEVYAGPDGSARTARTPTGRFTIERRAPGWQTSYLGDLYYPSYFYGGYAIHGSASVPPYPASHGCVRIPLHAARGFYERNAVGTVVVVHA